MFQLYLLPFWEGCLLDINNNNFNSPLFGDTDNMLKPMQIWSLAIVVFPCILMLYTYPIFFNYLIINYSHIYIIERERDHRNIVNCSCGFVSGYLCITSPTNLYLYNVARKKMPNFSLKHCSATAAGEL